MYYRSACVQRGRPRLLISAILCATAVPALSQSVITYDYDLQGQLESATNDTGPDTGYEYDPAGNRKSFAVSGVSGGAAAAAPEAETQSAAPVQDNAAPVCSPVSGCAGE